ncbi:uncharacterized protein LOC126325542 [Schistocerca gregaria]|uniref:uncharacterized protein LOC126325542 n=1 Tax=Schistocerca gregaria TaxID=7010 RepID=UPI00211DBC54|nr:uncharacterized protein LOC126325542 [Schistocerca gregaria]
MLIHQMRVVAEQSVQRLFRRGPKTAGVRSYFTSDALRILYSRAALAERTVKEDVRLGGARVSEDSALVLDLLGDVDRYVQCKRLENIQKILGKNYDLQGREQLFSSMVEQYLAYGGKPNETIVYALLKSSNSSFGQRGLDLLTEIVSMKTTENSKKSSNNPPSRADEGQDNPRNLAMRLIQNTELSTRLIQILMERKEKVLLEQLLNQFALPADFPAPIFDQLFEMVDNVYSPDFLHRIAGSKLDSFLSSKFDLKSHHLLARIIRQLPPFKHRLPETVHKAILHWCDSAPDSETLYALLQIVDWKACRAVPGRLRLVHLMTKHDDPANLGEYLLCVDMENTDWTPRQIAKTVAWIWSKQQFQLVLDILTAWKLEYLSDHIEIYLKFLLDVHKISPEKSFLDLCAVLSRASGTSACSPDRLFQLYRVDSTTWNLSRALPESLAILVLARYPLEAFDGWTIRQQDEFSTHFPRFCALFPRSISFGHWGAYLCLLLRQAACWPILCRNIDEFIASWFLHRRQELRRNDRTLLDRALGELAERCWESGRHATAINLMSILRYGTSNDGNSPGAELSLKDAQLPWQLAVRTQSDSVRSSIDRSLLESSVLRMSSCNAAIASLGLRLGLNAMVLNHEREYAEFKARDIELARQVWHLVSKIWKVMMLNHERLEVHSAKTILWLLKTLEPENMSELILLIQMAELAEIWLPVSTYQIDGCLRYMYERSLLVDGSSIFCGRRGNDWITKLSSECLSRRDAFRFLLRCFGFAGRAADAIQLLRQQTSNHLSRRTITQKDIHAFLGQCLRRRDLCAARQFAEGLSDLVEDQQALFVYMVTFFGRCGDLTAAYQYHTLIRDELSFLSGSLALLDAISSNRLAAVEARKVRAKVVSPELPASDKKALIHQFLSSLFDMNTKRLIQKMP